MAGSLGDLLFRDSSVWKRLAGNTSATRKFLSQTGSGAASAAPAWNQPAVSDLTGFGTNVATFLATPSSANLAAALTDETGSGPNVFATSPSLTTPDIPSMTSGGKTITVTPATGSLPIIIKSTGTASGTTNSLTEANLAAVLIPGGIMGTNGSLYIETLYKFVGTAGLHTVKVRHSTSSGDTSTGTLIMDNGSAGATTLSQSQVRRLWNANSASSQVFMPVVIALGLGASTSTVATGAINTGADSYINFNALVANSGDTAQIVAYTVTFYPGV